MMFLSIILLFTTHGCLKLDIILVADLSGSVYRYEYFVADAFDAFIDRFELSETGVKVGVIVFNDSPALLTGLTADKIKIRRAINIIRDATGTGSTNMTDTFYAVTNELVLNGRKDVKKVIIIVSDGIPNRRNTTLKTVMQLRIMYDLTVCGVWIGGPDRGQEFMQNISSEYCYAASDYKGLVKQLKRLDICI